jgi:hypothetical protein
VKHAFKNITLYYMVGYVGLLKNGWGEDEEFRFPTSYRDRKTSGLEKGDRHAMNLRRNGIPSQVALFMESGFNNTGKGKGAYNLVTSFIVSQPPHYRSSIKLDCKLFS